jgi:TrmH family RNA methyltransferase
MITSTKNAKVQRLRALQARPKTRREQNAFVIEGVRLAEAALQAGWQPEVVLYSDTLGERGLELVKQAASQGAVGEHASEHVMKAVSDTHTPQGLVMVLPFQPFSLPENLNFVLVADQVRDPGNLGTILRSAAAAGVQAVLLAPGTADAYAPKVLRAGMGAHFQIPVFALGWDEIAAACRGLFIWLAAAGQGQAYTEANLGGPLALLIGGEAAGASADAQELAADSLQIPMPGASESLNAGMAASILMFEVLRQRATP